MTRTKRHFTTAPLTSDELATLKQLHTLIELFDKGLGAALTASALRVQAHDVASQAVTPQRRATDLPAAVKALPAASAPRRRGARVVYRVRDGRVQTAKDLGLTDQEVYKRLHAAKSGLSRFDLLKALHAGDHTGIVDGALRRLRLKKLITAQFLTQE